MPLEHGVLLSFRLVNWQQGMGLGPRLIDPGGFVGILVVSPVRLVLRAVDRYHMLLGECYDCHGVMEGEDARVLDDGKLSLQHHVLR